ncbi:MAG: amidohydrolase [Psychroflexus sp.]
MKIKFYYFVITILVSITFLSCSESKIQVDTLFINAKIYTVDSDFSTTEALAVKGDKILAVGSVEELQSNYEAAETIDAKGKTMLPGLIDAHAHLYNLGLKLNQVDLDGTQSFEEVVSKTKEFYKKNPNTDYIIGRGWDQNDWDIQEYPSKDTLDKLFPETPVALTRIDGHAMLVNQAALDRAEIDENTEIFGGEILKENGKLTGVLIDNPMSKIRNSFPETDRKSQTEALQSAEKVALSFGLTSLVDAGLKAEIIHLINDLQQSDKMKIRIYAMLSNNESEIDQFLDSGILKTNKLNVRSVKVYADGALGSRGAALKSPYTDKDNHFGSMIIDLNEFKTLAAKLSKSEFQMNTHAIGDSANYVVLKTYDSLLKTETNRRWRVEHAQVMDAENYNLFGGENIIPSVQPTHATSDMYWAEERLGKDRIKHAYAYKNLLNEAGKIALGTDFPIEKVNPFLTFYAAVARQDLEEFPEGGFNPENALSREETLRGMTIWAAYANFEDEEKGSLEPGKFADFIFIDQDIMNVDIHKVPETQVLQTFIGGKEVYSAE